MPRSRYSPTPEDRLRVHERAAIGMSDDDMAAQLRLPVRRFQKLFRFEIKEGAAAGRERALTKLHSLAISDKHPSVLLFLVKARCGWRDTGPTHSAADVIERIVMYRHAAGKSRDEQHR